MKKIPVLLVDPKIQPASGAALKNPFKAELVSLSKWSLERNLVIRANIHEYRAEQ